MPDPDRIERLIAGTTMEDRPATDDQAAAGAQRAILEAYRRAHPRPPLDRLDADALAHLRAGRPLRKAR